MKTLDAGWLADLVGTLRYAMLTTCGAQGELVSRPLQTLSCDADSTLWFFTSAASGKVQELERDPRVNLTYADPAQKIFVSIAGEGQVLHDEVRARALWRLEQTIFFPHGPTDPDLRILKVRPHAARYWDGNASMLETAIKFGRAVLEGERSDLGTRGDIALHTGIAPRRSS